MAVDRRQRPGYPHPSSPEATTKMVANRGKNTTPELRLRSRLHREGLRYRVHLPVRVDARRPVSIDVAFPKLKLAVFIDGCFWHGCREHRTVPKANGAYWGPKLTKNVERDLETTARLEQAGWTVRRYWEHDDPRDVAALVANTVAQLRNAYG